MILSLFLSFCVVQASLGQVDPRGSYRPNKVGERGVIYYPGGPKWGYNNSPVQTTPAPQVESKKTYQTYDLRGLKQYDDSKEDRKKYSDFSRYETKEAPSYFQQQKVAYPRALREYRVTDSHRRKPQQLHQQKLKQQLEQQQQEQQQYQQYQQRNHHKQQQQQPQLHEEREPTFLLISPKDAEWTKADRDWLKKTESLWDKSDEWSPATARQWKEKPEANWNKRLESDWDQQFGADYEPSSSEGRTYKQSDDQSPEQAYSRRQKENRPRPNAHYEEEAARPERKQKEMNVYGRQGYLIAQQPRSSGRRLVSRYKDPCVRKPDGQYVLSRGFKELFPYVDNICYFVKCANKKAFLNPCSPGTRNDEQGDGFCSHLDLEGFCGLTVYDTAKKNKLKKAVQPKPVNNNNYHEYLHGTYYRS